MILGSMSPPLPNKGEDEASVLAEHTQKLQREHIRIVQEWRAYFGRLPSSSPVAKKTPDTATKSSSSLSSAKDRRRSDFGIVDNNEDDWDANDVDDCREIVPIGIEETLVLPAVVSPPPPPVPAPVAPTRVGLRPGGRVHQP